MTLSLWISGRPSIKTQKLAPAASSSSAKGYSGGR